MLLISEAFLTKTNQKLTKSQPKPLGETNMQKLNKIISVLAISAMLSLPIFAAIVKTDVSWNSGVPQQKTDVSWNS